MYFMTKFILGRFQNAGIFASVMFPYFYRSKLPTYAFISWNEIKGVP
jgi:hypothetical protein